MNNGTKSANIMTWAKFKKMFNPELVKCADSIFGNAIQIVQPTMIKMGFTENILYDAEEDISPLQQVKAAIDVFKYTYIVYYKWKYRDGSGIGISIYYN